MENVVHHSNRQKAVEIIKNDLAISENIDPQTLISMENILNTVIDRLDLTAAILANPSNKLFDKNEIVYIDNLPASSKIACQGVEGAYSHIASKTLFSDPHITFYPFFEDVVKDVSLKNVEYGILPVENSSAGSVEEVIELVCKYECYINSITQIKIQHCLAAPHGAKLENIKKVFSHPQALKQSAKFIKENGFEKHQVSNTAIAAQYIADTNKLDEACLCSLLSAKIYGLDVLRENVQDQKENYTRFICISKSATFLPNADTVSVALSFPNRPGALGELLTMFSALNLDLSKIQSMPIGGADFNVRFHLDFSGNITDKRVASLLGHMYDLYDDFQFLGNFGKI